MGLPLTFTPSQKTRTKKFDYFISLTPKFHHFGFNSQVPYHGAPIALLSLPQIGKENISIREYSTIFENSLDFIEGEVAQFDSKDFETSIGDFLLTDVVKTVAGRPNRPLWFVHDFVDRDGDFVSPDNGTRVEVYDKNLNNILNRWEVIEDLALSDLNAQGRRRLFHDLESYYNSPTDYEVYYVAYTFNKTRYFKLLSSNPVFLNKGMHSPLFNLSQNRRTYVLYPRGNRFEVTTLRSGTKFLKPLRTGQIRVYFPRIVTSKHSWLARISNGSFITQIDQEFNQYAVPEAPTGITMVRRTPSYSNMNAAVIISEKLVQSQYSPIITDQKKPIDVIVLDSTGYPKYAYTTNREKQYWTDQTGTKTVVYQYIPKIEDFSYDLYSGMIRLPIELESEDTVLVDCYYEEKFYEYPVELNPCLNRRLLNSTLVLYLMPSKLYATWTAGAKKGVAHFIMDENGYAVDCLRATDGTPYDPLVAAIAGEFKVDEFFEAYSDRVRLADINVGVFSSPKDIVDIDARMLGGGVKKTINLDDLAEQNPELNWLNDFSGLDGRTYPSAFASIVRIPASTIIGSGGNLTKQEVFELVQKHMAYGSYPVIQYYGEIPEIYWVMPDEAADTIAIYWYEVSSATEYDVKIAPDINGPWVTSTTTDTHLNVPLGGLYAPGDPIYIQVQAKDPNPGQSSKIVKAIV